MTMGITLQWSCWAEALVKEGYTNLEAVEILSAVGVLGFEKLNYKAWKPYEAKLGKLDDFLKKNDPYYKEATPECLK